jgi:hypothetical protein
VTGEIDKKDRFRESDIAAEMVKRGERHCIFHRRGLMVVAMTMAMTIVAIEWNDLLSPG